MRKRNTYTKIFTSTAVIFISFCILTVSAFAGPFIKIDSIDAQSEFPRIAVTISIHNVNKSFIPGLDESNILVYEDGYRVNYVKVKDLSDSEDLLYLVFSIDSSKSISQEFLKSICKSAQDIVNSTAPKDKIAVYRFNDDVILMNNFSENRLNIIDNINSIERHGTKTLLYNAIYDSLQILGDVNTKRKAVIVFTDGKDEGSSVTDNDVITFARDSVIPVYFISLESSPAIQTLGRIAKLSGGRLIYSKKHDDVVRMYQSILSMIKNRYVIQYQTISRADGAQHQVEVRLNYGNIRDRDIRSFMVQHDILFLNIFRDQNTVLLLMIVILMVVIIITLTWFFTHGAKRLKEGSAVSTGFLKKAGSGNQDDLVRLEEGERLREEEAIISHDPSFTYSDAWLIQKAGPETGKKFPLYWDETTLGSDKDNAIAVNDPAASPHHAKIKCIRDAYYLFDMISDGGTYLNGNKLLRPKILYDWDEIRVGKTYFIFRGSKITRETL